MRVNRCGRRACSHCEIPLVCRALTLAWFGRVGVACQPTFTSAYYRMSIIYLTISNKLFIDIRYLSGEEMIYVNSRLILQGVADRIHRAQNPLGYELADGGRDLGPAGGHGEPAVDHGSVQNFSFARRRAAAHGPARGRRARPRRNPA